MKNNLFDTTSIRDVFEWDINIPDFVTNDTCAIVALFDGFCLGCYDDRYFLMTGIKMQDLNIAQINELIESHKMDYWQDVVDKTIKPITVYETNLQFAKFDKWL